MRALSLFRSLAPSPAFAAAGLALTGAGLSHPGALQEQRYGVLRSMLPPLDTPTEALVVLDFDGNGGPDAYLAGLGQDRLYRNDGTGVFADESWRLPAESDAARDAGSGDVDGDGSPDLLVGTSSGTDRLYLNQGGIFADASGQLPADPAKTYAVALGDVDGDGDLDLWLGNSGAQSRLYLNAGSGVFADATDQIPQAAEFVADVALGDVDADGDLDALLAVADICATSLQDRLYLNDASGTFADATAQLPPDADVTAAAALGDVDGDADLDLLLGNARGCLSAGDQNRLSLNDGTGHFTDASGQLPSMEDNTQACALGDVDGDGDADALFGNLPLDVVTGFVAGENRLCLNDGAGVFSEAALLPLILGEWTSSIACADVDGDADLDVLVGNWGFDRLHLNDGQGAFSPVEAALPPDPKMAIGLGDANDDGLLDGFFITPSTVWFPYAALTAEQRLFLGDGAGSFSEARDMLPDVTRLALDAAFGDVDADGDTDILLACPYDGQFSGLVQDNLLYLNDGTGAFSDATAQLPTFPGDDRGLAWSAELIDVDGDGDLDALFAETNDYDGGGGGVTLFLNDGSGGFTDATGQVLYFGNHALQVATGDVDADGDVDLVAGSEPDWVHLMLNDGAGHFADATAQLPPLVEFGNTTFLGLGDVDGDLDLDLAFGRHDYSPSQERNLLYLNDGAGFFTDASGGVPQVIDEYLLADVDDDLDLDLLGGSALLLNAGGGTFEVALEQLPAGLGGPMELGDLDGDGDEDALVTLGTQALVWSNLTRHLAWRGLPRIGKLLVMDVYGAPGSPWLMAWSPAVREIALPPYGTLQLSPATIDVVGSGLMDPDGRASQRFHVPLDPGLVGLPLHWQALVGSPPRFTNRELTVFSDL